MAKIRVYELARELNMTNKVLLEKLGELDFDVKSHMSSLEDETATDIKAKLLGKKEEKTNVEVVRIKPTVIRRRKKTVEVEESIEVDAAEEEAPAVESDDVEALAVESPTPAEKDPSEAEAPEAEEATDMAETAQTVTAPEPGQEAASAELEAVATPKPDKPPKKKKADSAAKIIKLPTTPPPKAAPPPEEPSTPAEVVPIEALADEDRKGKKKTDPGKDKRFFKKKISFRRKEVIEGEDLYTRGRLRGKKGRKSVKAKAFKGGLKTQITVPKAIKRRVKIDETIVLSDLAKRMGIKAADMIRMLMSLDVMVTVNQTIDFETASLVAAEFDYEVEKATFEEEAVLKVEADDPENLSERPPVVTIMGHVDHGKTSLLDVIRKTRITEFEAGGITQHIGAYSVSTPGGQITFLDTPGHEAFTAMRARGAKVTDIVILVVAADDGVMPQTVEAINHSKAAGVPIIIAVNKIDKANADPERVIRELSDHGLVPEDWGGDTIFVQVSAKEATGIDELLEMILLQAEVLELRANPDKLARGHVVEAKLDSGRGPVATILIQDGTLNASQAVVCGIHHGKIRALFNDRGQQIISAGPAVPVEILGLAGVPGAGDEFQAVEDEKTARQVSLYRLQKQRSLELASSSRMSLEGLFEKMKEGEVKDLNLVIKADVHGSIEALKDSLTELSTDEVKINVVHSATGTITESDVSLAAVSNAIILGFNVRPNPKVHNMAHEERVDMRFYDVIYNAIKDVKDAMLGMMESTYEEHLLGRADVRQVFHVPKVGSVAGCYVTDGRIERNQSVRLLRDGVVMYEGKIASLKRFKDDAKEVQTGFECGISVERYNDIKVGDAIECYYLEEIKPRLD